MNKPEISVVIPTRDRARRLERTLAGALDQRGVDLEVIVVDDGSTDPVACANDPRIRVVRHVRSRGVATARNRGIAEARGKWVAFLDDDDLWAPTKLRTQLCAAKRAKASFVFGAGVMVDERLRVLRVVPPPEPDRLRERLSSLNAIPFGCSNVVACTELVRRVGGFDEQLSQLADWDLWHQLVSAGRAAATSEVVVAYVVHPENMLLTQEADVRREFDYFTAKVALRAGEGTVIDPARFSRWVAGGHLRAGRRRRAAGELLTSGLAQRDLGNVLRGLAAPLGEWGMVAYWRLRNTRTPAPSWLELYRADRRLARAVPPPDGSSSRPGGT
jgi:glycosyltransferase involved in cell wall biosynthesis